MCKFFVSKYISLVGTYACIRPFLQTLWMPFLALSAFILHISYHFFAALRRLLYICPTANAAKSAKTDARRITSTKRIILS